MRRREDGFFLRRCNGMNSVDCRVTTTLESQRVPILTQHRAEWLIRIGVCSCLSTAVKVESGKNVVKAQIQDDEGIRTITRCTKRCIEVGKSRLSL